MRLGLRFSALLVALTAVAGCGGLEGGGGFGEAPSELAPIVYEYTFAMATFSQQVKISPDGQMDVIQITGPAASDRKVARTQLTADQKADILKAFRGWSSLNHTYPAYFGPVMSISFNGYKVEGGDNENAAPALKHAKEVLDKVAVAAINAGRPAGQAAAAVAPALETPVEYRYDLSLQGPTLHRRVLVNRAGILQVSEVTTGPNGNEKPKEVAVQLPPAQMGMLVDALRKLPAGDVQFGSVADGPQMQVTYAGRTVGTGGTGDVPASFLALQNLLESYAQIAKNAAAGK